MPIFSIGERRVELRGAHHYIAHDATVVGSVTLEADVSVWFKVVIRADNDRISIGEGTNIQDGSVLHVDPGFPLTLGRMVSIGHKVTLHGCTIGDGSLVGINSIVMNGARIGKGSLIGANTLITEGKEIPDGVLVLGLQMGGLSGGGPVQGLIERFGALGIGEHLAVQGVGI